MSFHRARRRSDRGAVVHAVSDIVVVEVVVVHLDEPTQKPPKELGDENCGKVVRIAQERSKMVEPKLEWHRQREQKQTDLRPSKGFIHRTHAPAPTSRWL